MKCVLICYTSKGSRTGARLINNYAVSASSIPPIGHIFMSSVSAHLQNTVPPPHLVCIASHFVHARCIHSERIVKDRARPGVSKVNKLLMTDAQFNYVSSRNQRLWFRDDFCDTNKDGMMQLQLNCVYILLQHTADLNREPSCLTCEPRSDRKRTS